MNTPRHPANRDLRAVLDAGLQALSLTLIEAQCEQLLALIDLLGKWNRAYNLTAIREPRDMVIKHLLDSLAVADAVRGTRVLDVGTGGGFPGLPLAIAQPERQFVLLDASSKKVRFVQRAIDTLQLGNASAVHARVEDYVETAFDTIVCRAFASLADILELTQHLVAGDGVILAMKGQALPAGELQAIGADWCAEQRPVVVPLLTGERHLVTVSRTNTSTDTDRNRA